MNGFNDATILKLSFAFPSLEKADGLSPWNPVRLDSWAIELGRSRNELHSARFLLSVWNSEFDWDCGVFDPQSAIRSWDRIHRRAYLDYASQDFALAC